jgi:hypothetical protein
MPLSLPSKKTATKRERSCNKEEEKLQQRGREAATTRQSRCNRGMNVRLLHIRLLLLLRLHIA